MLGMRHLRLTLIASLYPKPQILHPFAALFREGAVVGLRFGEVKIGAVRSSPWTWDFSSMESTIAFSGWFRYSPTTSRTSASNSGLVENLNVITRHGCRSHPDLLTLAARQADIVDLSGGATAE